MKPELVKAWELLTKPGAPYAMEPTDAGSRRIRTFTEAPGNLSSVWRNASSAYADRDFLIFEDERLTFKDAASRANALVAHLHHNRVRKGDRVLVAMRNFPEWILSHWAVLQLGGVVVAANAWWTTDELAYCIDDANPSAIVADPERVERLRPLLPSGQLSGRTLLAARPDDGTPDAFTSLDAVYQDRAHEAVFEEGIAPEADALIFYTSGTSGRPKGVRLSHRGCIHNVMHIGFWRAVRSLAAELTVRPDIDPSEAVAKAIAGPPQRLLVPAPLFHVTACNCQLHPGTMAGHTLVLMRKWDPSVAIDLIEREHVNSVSGVPTMARDIMLHPTFGERDLSSLKQLGGGGAPFPPELVDRIAGKLGDNTPSTGYGMTETSGIITNNSGEYFVEKPTSCGPIMPTFDAQIRAADGTNLGDRDTEVGELWVSGPTVMTGYVTEPDTTSPSLVDGWFRTGDLARVDKDGWLYVVGRAKDIIIRGGENIAASEVEAELYHIPGVREAIAFAVPDDRLGESVGVAIRPEDGSRIAAPEVLAAAAERLPSHKRPTSIWIIDGDPPRTASGKVLKAQLRETLLRTAPDTVAPS